MNILRDTELYVPREVAAKLRFLAEVKNLDSADALATLWLEERIAKDYPECDAVMAKANRERRKVLDAARDELKQKEPTTF